MKSSASSLLRTGRFAIVFLMLLTASVNASANGGGPAKRSQHLHHKGLFHKLFNHHCLHHHSAQ